MIRQYIPNKTNKNIIRHNIDSNNRVTVSVWNKHEKLKITRITTLRISLYITYKMQEWLSTTIFLTSRHETHVDVKLLEMTNIW